MKHIIKKLLREGLMFTSELNEDAFNVIETELLEDYSNSFSIDEFKKLNSFASRVKYCEEHLKRISSGSSRIVYKIDDEKVLKLAKNKKGLAQNEIEIEYSQYQDINDITARVFDIDANNLWIEMELARRLKTSDFLKITGFEWKDYVAAIHNHGEDANAIGKRQYIDLDPDIAEAMWEDDFCDAMFDYLGYFKIPVGDLKRTSTYGVVKRDGKDTVVMIDYGLTSDVYKSYYN
tara:strand:- start:214 stop:915 length:702 start_codon:yes stop_codon:yes gene_type:complete